MYYEIVTPGWICPKVKDFIPNYDCLNIQEVWS